MLLTINDLKGGGTRHMSFPGAICQPGPRGITNDSGSVWAKCQQRKAATQRGRVKPARSRLPAVFTMVHIPEQQPQRPGRDTPPPPSSGFPAFSILPGKGHLGST